MVRLKENGPMQVFISIQQISNGFLIKDESATVEPDNNKPIEFYAELGDALGELPRLAAQALARRKEAMECGSIFPRYVEGGDVNANQFERGYAVIDTSAFNQKATEIDPIFNEDGTTGKGPALADDSDV
jgi:hypothetical protein